MTSWPLKVLEMSIELWETAWQKLYHVGPIQYRTENLAKLMKVKLNGGQGVLSKNLLPAFGQD